MNKKRNKKGGRQGKGPLVELQAHTIIWGKSAWNLLSRGRFRWSVSVILSSRPASRRCSGQRANCRLFSPPLSSGLLPAASHYVCRDQREGEGGDEGREKNKQRRGKCLPSYRVFTSFLRKSGEKRGRIRRDKIEKEGANFPTESYSHRCGRWLNFRGDGGRLNSYSADPALLLPRQPMFIAEILIRNSKSFSGRFNSQKL